MKFLIIYCHPNPQSFNHAILQEFIKGLEETGKEFEVVDLYKSGFDPILKIGDFVGMRGENIPKDILEQQDKVKNADIIIFIHPTWWGGMPAMLKGYLDRIFSIGFAYKMGKAQPEGLLGDKKVLIIRTTALPEELYLQSGVENLVRTLSSYKFQIVCGVKDLQHYVFYAVPSVSEEVRKTYLQKVKELGNQL